MEYTVHKACSYRRNFLQKQDFCSSVSHAHLSLLCSTSTLIQVTNIIMPNDIERAKSRRAERDLEKEEEVDIVNRKKSCQEQDIEQGSVILDVHSQTTRVVGESVPEPPNLQRSRSRPGAFPMLGSSSVFALNDGIGLNQRGVQLQQQQQQQDTTTTDNNPEVLVSAELVDPSMVTETAVVSRSITMTSAAAAPSLVFGEAMDDSQSKMESWKIVRQSGWFRFGLLTMIAVFGALLFGTTYGLIKSNANPATSLLPALTTNSTQSILPPTPSPTLESVTQSTPVPFFSPTLESVTQSTPVPTPSPTPEVVLAPTGSLVTNSSAVGGENSTVTLFQPIVPTTLFPSRSPLSDNSSSYDDHDDEDDYSHSNSLS